MKYMGIIVCLILLLLSVIISFDRRDPDPLLYFDHNGILNTGRQMRHFEDSIIPSAALNQSFNISSAGFTHILNITLLAKDSTTTVSNMTIPIMSYYNLTSVVFNILSSNTTLISLLGVNVNGLTAPSSVPSGTVIYCKVDGY